MKLEVKINRLENAVIKLGNKEVVLDGEFLSVDTFESGKYIVANGRNSIVLSKDLEEISRIEDCKILIHILGKYFFVKCLDERSKYKIIDIETNKTIFETNCMYKFVLIGESEFILLTWTQQSDDVVATLFTCEQDNISISKLAGMKSLSFNVTNNVLFFNKLNGDLGFMYLFNNQITMSEDSYKDLRSDDIYKDLSLSLEKKYMAYFIDLAKKYNYIGLNVSGPDKDIELDTFIKKVSDMEGALIYDLIFLMLSDNGKKHNYDELIKTACEEYIDDCEDAIEACDNFNENQSRLLNAGMLPIYLAMYKACDKIFKEYKLDSSWISKNSNILSSKLQELYEQYRATKEIHLIRDIEKIIYLIQYAPSIMENFS